MHHIGKFFHWAATHHSPFPLVSTIAVVMHHIGKFFHWAATHSSPFPLVSTIAVVILMLLGFIKTVGPEIFAITFGVFFCGLFIWGFVWSVAQYIKENKNGKA